MSDGAPESEAHSAPDRASDRERASGARWLSRPAAASVESPLARLRSLARARGRAAGRWAWASALLLFVERLLLVVVAATVGEGTNASSMTMALALGGVAIVRAGVRGLAQAKTLRALHDAAIRGVLDSDAGRALVLDDDDVEAVALDAFDHATRLLSDSMPQLVADALASIVVLALAFIMLPTAWAVGLAVLALVGLGSLLVLRRQTARSVARVWSAYRPVLDLFIGGIEGRQEIVANGRRHGYLVRFERRVDEWYASTLHDGMLERLISRVPVALPVAVGALALFWLGGRDALERDAALATAFVAAAAVPPLFGATRALHETLRALARLEPSMPLFAAREHSRETSVDASAPAALSLHALVGGYPDRARRPMHPLTFEVRRGEPVVLVGANGAGKSTAIKCLAGLVEAREGAIHADGEPLLPDRFARAGRIAYLPQRAYVPRRGRVRDAFAFLLDVVDEGRARAALERVGLIHALESRWGDALDAPVAELSVGERQRLVLARVLQMDADIVLLDEPDAHLDRDGVAMLEPLIVSLAERSIVVVAAHDASLADRFRSVVLEPVDA